MFNAHRLMRPSPLLHPVAVLRKELGLGQKELANLCKCSSRTIQAVELKKLTLSEGLALRIQAATGAGMDWLLAGDPFSPTLDNHGGPYDKRMFEKMQARKDFPVSLPSKLVGREAPRVSGRPEIKEDFVAKEMEAWAEYLHAQIYDVLLNCLHKTGDYEVPLYRFRKVVRESVKEFGSDKSDRARTPAAASKLRARILRLLRATGWEGGWDGGAQAPLGRRRGHQ
ncbi:MAG: helix-turn-helix transcriptional regulator [Chthoniobacterales bacterium]